MAPRSASAAVLLAALALSAGSGLAQPLPAALMVPPNQSNPGPAFAAGEHGPLTFSTSNPHPQWLFDDNVFRSLPDPALCLGVGGPPTEGAVPAIVVHCSPETPQVTLTSDLEVVNDENLVGVIVNNDHRVLAMVRVYDEHRGVWVWVNITGDHRFGGQIAAVFDPETGSFIWVTVNNDHRLVGEITPVRDPETNSFIWVSVTGDHYPAAELYVLAEVGGHGLFVKALAPPPQ